MANSYQREIKELYVYCVEACISGQKEIGLTIFTAKVNDANYSELVDSYKNNRDKISFWVDLKKSYDLFNQTRVQPAVKFLPDGTHDVN